MLRLEKSLDLGREILKWIAISTMTVDHLGAIFFPNQIIFRIIGRISFPLSCYLMVLGAKSTRNLRSYFLRLVVFALISQIPYSIAFGIGLFEKMNVFFTLSLGFLIFINPIMILISFLVSFLLVFDYGQLGIVMMACMQIVEEDERFGFISLILLGVFSILISDIQVYFLFVIPIIILYRKFDLRTYYSNMRRLYPPWMGILYYFFYPIHLLMLHLLDLIL